MAILNWYKASLDDFIDSLDPESPNQARPIDKRSCNVFIFKKSLTDLLKEDCLDENLSGRLS